MDIFQYFATCNGDSNTLSADDLQDFWKRSDENNLDEVQSVGPSIQIKTKFAILIAIIIVEIDEHLTAIKSIHPPMYIT